MTENHTSETQITTFLKLLIDFGYPIVNKTTYHLKFKIYKTLFTVLVT
jgi:hypothetical protein